MLRLCALWPWLLALGAGALVYAAKLQLISQYGSPVPFVDQWSGEGIGLYRPWLMGEYSLRELFAAHNEHRIVFTRLLDLLVLELNGQWDSRLLMVVQAALPALFCLVVVLAATRWMSVTRAWLVAAVTVIFFSSNVSYGNTLWAFQSQFYFFLLFTALHIGLTFEAKPMRGAWWAGHVFGLANLFTVAAGVFSSIAVAATSLWSLIVHGNRQRSTVVTIAWNVAVAAIGLLISRNDTSNDQARHIFRAESLPDAGRMVGNFFAWPFSASSDSRMWVVVFAPVAVWLCLKLYKCNGNSIDRVLLALVLVVTMQNVALGLFRGVPWSRYLDSLSLGIAVNIACALAIDFPKRWRPLQWVLTLAWSIAVIQALFAQQEDFRIRAFPPLLQDRRADLMNIRAIVRGEAIPSQTTVGGLGSATAISVVTDPVLRTILPYAFRPSIELQLDEGSGFGKRFVSAGEWPDSPTPGFTTVAITADSPATYRSQAIETTFPYLYFLIRTDSPLTDRQLWLETLDGNRVGPHRVSALPGGTWRAVLFAAPCSSFWVVAGGSEKETLEFSEPVEVGRWTVAAEALMNQHMAVLAGGALLLVLSVGMAFAGWSDSHRRCSVQ